MLEDGENHFYHLKFPRFFQIDNFLDLLVHLYLGDLSTTLRVNLHSLCFFFSIEVLVSVETQKGAV